MSHRKLMLFASAVVILNLLDAIFTLAYTKAGLATEGNPIMKAPLSESPALFMIAKLSLVSVCVLLLARLGNRRPAFIGLAAAATMYACIICYHLAAMPRLVALL